MIEGVDALLPDDDEVIQTIGTEVIPLTLTDTIINELNADKNEMLKIQRLLFREKELKAELDQLTTDHKDTVKHSLRVAIIAQRLAKHIGLSEQTVHEILAAGVFHDLGKGDEEVLKAVKEPGKLTDKQWVAIKKHPQIGVRKIEELTHGRDILGKNLNKNNILRLIESHHAFKTGNPYPPPTEIADSADLPYEIAIGRELLALADMIDAYANPRGYKPPFSENKSRQFLHEDSVNMYMLQAHTNINQVIEYTISEGYAMADVEEPALVGV